jgi:hypothetical protein
LDAVALEVARFAGFGVVLVVVLAGAMPHAPIRRSDE